MAVSHTSFLHPSRDSKTNPSTNETKSLSLLTAQLEETSIAKWSFLLSQWNRKESGNKERIYLPWGAGETLVYHRSFWIIFSSTSFFELPFSGWGGRGWWWGSLSSNSLWRCSRIHPDDHWSWSLFRKRAALLTNSLDPRNMDTWKDAAWPKCPHSVCREGKGHPTQCLVFFLPGSLTSWSSLCFWD